MFWKGLGGQIFKLFPAKKNPHWLAYRDDQLIIIWQDSASSEISSTLVILPSSRYIILSGLTFVFAISWSVSPISRSHISWRWTFFGKSILKGQPLSFLPFFVRSIIHENKKSFLSYILIYYSWIFFDKVLKSNRSLNLLLFCLLCRNVCC